MTTCEDVRTLLPDFVLGSTERRDELDLRRHLRGCGACRRELDALREGLGVFASTLERTAPSELRDRVMSVLSEEWTEAIVSPRSREPASRRWNIALAASIALVLVAGAFGLIQLDRARDATKDATSFRTVLATLGGTGFKVGTLEAATETPVEGSVVAYESSKDQSFVVVFVRTPELTGEGSLLVSRSDGTTWDPGPIEFDGDGDAAVWWVTDRSITSMTGLTVAGPDGSRLATAGLRPA
ncbi:MAG: anti-sigma factor [Actinomycetota bacterium]|nr:anti-sigma factor [Actinomycetota bacterium]